MGMDNSFEGEGGRNQTKEFLTTLSIPKSFQFQPLQRVSEYLRLDLGLEQFSGLVTGRGLEGVKHRRVVEHHFMFGQRQNAVSQPRDRLPIFGIHWP